MDDLPEIELEDLDPILDHFEGVDKDVGYEDEEKEVKEIVSTKSMEPRHRILREVYRHYTDFYDLWRLGGYGTSAGKHILEYKGVEISFLDLDLKKNLSKLSGRKRQAFILNVLYDMKQKDVAEIMNITTVSV